MIDCPESGRLARAGKGWFESFNLNNASYVRREKMSDTNKIPDINRIMKYENGEMTQDEEIELLTELRDAGMLSQLQGFYGRAAHAYGLI